MAFRLINHGGVWIVSRDSPNMRASGGTVIPYSMYQKLKDAPHTAAYHFDLDESGNVIPRPIVQTSTRVQN